MSNAPSAGIVNSDGEIARAGRIVFGANEMFTADISLKRSIVSLLFQYSAFLDKTNWTSKCCRMVRQADCPRFHNREEMYGYLQHTFLKDVPIAAYVHGARSISTLIAISLGSMPSLDCQKTGTRTARRERLTGTASRLTLQIPECESTLDYSKT
jgi:hypothetical protein